MNRKLREDVMARRWEAAQPFSCCIRRVCADLNLDVVMACAVRRSIGTRDRLVTLLHLSTPEPYIRPDPKSGGNDIFSHRRRQSLFCQPFGEKCAAEAQSLLFREHLSKGEREARQEEDTERRVPILELCHVSETGYAVTAFARMPRGGPSVNRRQTRCRQREFIVVRDF